MMENRIIKVLLVEDDADHAELVSRSLKRNNVVFELVNQSGFKAACDWLEENQTDILISDLRLPDGSGIDFLLKADSLIKFPVIIITSQGDEQHAVEAMKAGALDYVVKSPDSFRELPHIIQRALREWELMQEKRAAEEKLRSIFRAAPVGIGVVVNRVLKEVNQTICNMLGYAKEELLDQSARILYPTDEDFEFVGREKYRQIAEKGTGMVETRWRKKNGDTIHIILSSAPINPADLSAGVTFTAVDITDRKKAEEEVKRQAMVLEQIQDQVTVTDLEGRIVYVNEANCRVLGRKREDLVGQMVYIYSEDPEQGAKQEDIIRITREQGEWRGEVVNYTVDQQEIILDCRTGLLRDENGIPYGMYGISTDITKRKKNEEALRKSEERFHTLVDASPNAILVIQDRKYVFANPASLSLLGYTADELIGMDALAVIHPDDQSLLPSRFRNLEAGKSNPRMEMRILKKNGEIIYTESTSVPIIYNDRPAVLVISYDITERKRAAEEIRRSRDKLEAAERLAKLGNYEIDLQTGTAVWSKEVFEIFGMQPEEGEPTVETYAGLIHPEDREAVYSMFYRCAQEGTPFDLVYRIFKKSGEIRYVHSLAGVEMDNDGKGKRMFGTFQDITERIRIEQALMESQHQIKERMRQLMVLRDIDIAITSYTSMNKIVETILGRLVSLPDICAAILLIADVPGSMLKIAAQTGLEPPVNHLEILKCPHLEVNQIAEAHVPIFVNDYPCRECVIQRHSPVEIRSCAILPLLVHDDFKGILILLSRQPDLFDRSWQDFAHSLSMQTAIAVENAALFTEMQYKHLELMEAYEATIEGWSRTLEMRDKETKGHTERVTRISLLLAVEFGYRNEDLWNFRRGVLLHDIGKISIPDSILFKPGPLSDDEWIIMRQHPTYAYQMLQGIAVLEKASTIPYYHHEKWDGSGYPHGLRGEDIPLGARIFAVVDVWDALTSDRPYRPAWTKEMARQYIIEQSGRHFDPKVVEVFINLLDSGKIGRK